MRRLVLLLPFALLALVTVPSLDRPSPLDAREARDVLVAHEMRARGEWVQPRLAGEPNLDKPAAGYALEWLSWRAFDGCIATSRAVRASALALLLGVVMLLATRIVGSPSAPFAGIAFATSLGVPLAARVDGTAILAALLAWLGIAALAPSALDADRPGAPPRTRARAAGWGAFGLATACAGPLAGLWPLAGFALHARLVRSPRAWSALSPWAGAAIVAGCALPWYGAMAAAHGPGRLLRAFAHPYGDQPAGAWYAGVLVACTYGIVVAFPWTPLLAVAVRDEGDRLRAERRGGAPPADVAPGHRTTSLLLSLLFAAAVPLALWPTPPLTAAFASLPATALLVGGFAARVWRGEAGARLVPGAARMSALVATILAVLVATTAPRLGDIAAPLQHASALLLVSAWLPVLAGLAGRRRLALALFAAPVALGAPFALTRVLPAMEPWLSARPVAGALDVAAPPGAPLVLLAEPPPSLRLATGHALIVRAEPWAELVRWRAADGRAYLAFAPDRERDAARRAPAPLEVLLRTPAMVLARVDVPAAAASEFVRPPGAGTP